MAEEQKKGFFGRLFGTQKKGGCCSYRIVEIPKDQDADEVPEKNSPRSDGPSSPKSAIDLSRSSAERK